MFGLVGQGMRPNRIVRGRFVFGGCRQPCGFGEHPGGQRQQITKDTRQGEHDVNARPAQLGQWNQLGAGHAAKGIVPRFGAHQRQRLPDRRAFGLQIIGTPENQGDRRRIIVAVGAMSL